MMFKTLIVEDNAVFRQSLVETLSSRFPTMAIHEAGNGKVAMQQVNDFDPDLVFMDIKLPDENGLNLTRSIKAAHSATSVVIITTHDIPEYREAARLCGACHFIPKGSSSGDDILTLVESIMAGASAAG